MEIEVRNLKKRYGKKNVLDNISITITNGPFGLLGENGAGKSTFMKILVGAVEKSEGEIFINGSPINRKRLRSILGYLPQDFTMYGGMTVTQSLDYLAALSGLSSKRRKERIEVVQKMLKLEEVKHIKVKHLSGGVLKRLGLAQALLNDPQILIIDEPTAGVDLDERIQMRNLLSEIAQNKIVILSTHIVEDIEMVCPKLAIMSEGKIIHIGTVESILTFAKNKIYVVEVEKELVEYIKTKYKVINIQYRSNKAFCRICSNVEPEFYAEKVEHVTLEDGYIALIGGYKDDFNRN